MEEELLIQRQTFCALLIVFTGFLGGCSFFGSPSQVIPSFKLLPPSAFKVDKTLTQSVTVRHRGQQQSFILVTRIQNNELKSEALLTTGQTLFRAFYNGHELTHEVYVPSNLPIESMFAEMQFSLWPLLSLYKAYQPSDGWDIQLKNEAEIEERQLFYGGQLLLKVTKNKDSINIVNMNADYRVDVKMLEY